MFKKLAFLLVLPLWAGCSKPSHELEDRLRQVEADVAQLKAEAKVSAAKLVEAPRAQPATTPTGPAPKAAGQLDRLLGVWHDIGPSRDIVEFSADGSLAVSSGGSPEKVTGQWLVLPDGRLKMEFPVLGTTETNLARVSFDRDEMILTTANGRSIRHRRAPAPDPQQPALRQQAAQVLEELRMLDGCIDQFAIEANKSPGDPATAADLLLYVKRGTRLAKALADPAGPKDLLGNPYEPFVVDTIPRVHPATLKTFAGTVPDSYWGPYLNGN